ncbi:MAG: GAF domain-containing protein [Myxococcales bacterium]|nr:GAF domain-containing protein [Myxococcales bacterium]
MVTAVVPERSDAYAILDLLPHAVIVVAADWRVVYANPEAGRMIGEIGATLWERCPELEQTAFASGFRYAMSDRSELLTESALPRVGWSQARARPLPDGGLVISLRQANPHLVETGLAKQALMVGEIGDALTREESLHSALRRCTAALVRNLDAAVARIWTLDSATRTLELCASSGLEAALDGFQEQVAVGETKIGQIADDGEPYLTNDVATDRHVGGSEWIPRERIVAFAGYPLRVEDRIVGVLAMYSRKPIDHDVLNALSASLDALALGIARKTADAARRRAEAALRANAEQVETLYELSTRMTAELEVAPLAQILIDTATRLAGAEVGAFFFQLPGTKGEAFTSYAVSGLPQGALGRMTPVRYDDLRQASAFKKLDELQMPSAVELPVTGRRSQRRSGVLVLLHRRPSAFSVETERLLANVAATAAIALDNARLFEEARGLIAALEKSNAELDQFAYVASHDLKAPLRGIANLASWIEDDLGDTVSDDTRDHLELLKGRVLRLENLIAGILSYSRAGRDPDGPRDVDLRQLASEVWELLAPPDSAKLVLGEELPTIRGSRVQLQQVLMNLIGNAVKYNAARGVTVELTAARSGDHWDVVVADDGVGVPKEFHERIWGLFQTLERRDKVESTGIGLSVVRKIVEANHGKTWVENRARSGAAFHFTWPAVTQEESHG